MQPIRNNDVRALYQAAATGDVTTLLSLLNQDSRVLDKSVAQGCCTPLHIAAKLGHLEFIKAVLERKPGFVGIQDFEGSTSLHLAVANGHVEVAKAFLEVDTEISLAKDCRGRNPLHISIIRGGLELLQALVEAKPEAALALTDEGETILHLCVRNSRSRALCFLVESLEGMNTAEFMNTKDCDGFTALHLAVAEKQTEIVKYLIEKTMVDINKLTTKGYTALDIVEVQRRRNTTDINIIDILQYNGAISSKSSSTAALVPEDPDNAQIEVGKNVKRKKTKKTNTRAEWVEKKRSTLMVVASLIATMAYEAGTTPPVNVSQESNFRMVQANPPVNDWQEANDSIYRTNFMVWNSVGFLASLFVILLLISGLPFKRKGFMWILILVMWLAVTSMANAYIYNLFQANYLRSMWTFLSFVLVFWLCLLGSLLLGHMIRLIIKAIRFMKKKKKMTSSPAPSRHQNAAV